MFYQQEAGLRIWTQLGTLQMSVQDLQRDVECRAIPPYIVERAELRCDDWDCRCNQIEVLVWVSFYATYRQGPQGENLLVLSRRYRDRYQYE